MPKLNIMKFTSIIEKCNDGCFTARCMEVDDISAQGKTMDEANDNLFKIIHAFVKYVEENRPNKNPHLLDVDFI